MKKLFVIFAAIALVGAFTATAMAADWSFYGSSRMKTFYESWSEDYSGTGDSESTAYWAQQGNSRIGARVKASDTISGRFEYGTGVNLRLLYGEWAFSDNGSLLIGQAYTPMSIFVGSQVWADDDGLIGIGADYGLRLDQIKLKIAGFEIALIEQPVGGFDNYMPKIEAAYNLALGSVGLQFIGGYNSYKDLASDETVTSYVGGIGVTGSFGPAWFNASFHGGQNLANASWYGNAAPDFSIANAATPGGEDTTSMAFAAAAGMAASEQMSFQLGAGYGQDENDDYGDKTDKVMSVYLQMKYAFAPGFAVYPEVGYVDFMKDMADNDEGNITYFGAKWQIDF
ncbi:MAG: hypothetical protein LJE94_08050 [Deltaproteobacteria bacterium]|nr:hypothetical protein [Deltaproteobacteria bacterium]